MRTKVSACLKPHNLSKKSFIIVCMENKQTHTHTHTETQIHIHIFRLTHTHTHTQSHTHTITHTHTHTHTHTVTKIFDLPQTLESTHDPFTIHGISHNAQENSSSPPPQHTHVHNILPSYMWLGTLKIYMQLFEQIGKHKNTHTHTHTCTHTHTHKVKNTSPHTPTHLPAPPPHHTDTIPPCHACCQVPPRYLCRWSRWWTSSPVWTILGSDWSSTSTDPLHQIPPPLPLLPHTPTPSISDSQVLRTVIVADGS